MVALGGLFGPQAHPTLGAMVPEVGHHGTGISMQRMSPIAGVRIRRTDGGEAIGHSVGHILSIDSMTI